MAVSLLNKNYNTNICQFSFDDWNEDKDKLPKLTSRGKDLLSTILSCNQGSLAIGTNGEKYALTGSNEWVKYSSFSSSGGEGEIDPDIEEITTEEIESLFK